MKNSIFIVLLLLFGGVSMAQTWEDGKWYYKTGQGNGDGFSQSSPKLEITEMLYEKQICDGSSTVIGIIINGTDLMYYYEWFEVGQEEVILSDKSFLYLPQCDYDTYNGKRYQCRVTGFEGDMELLSPEVTLTVIPKPVVSIISPTENVIIPAGNSVTLKAASIPSNSGIKYTWTGSGLPAVVNSATITVKPEESSDYVVYAENRGCVGISAGFPVQVVRLPDLLPEEKFIFRGDSVCFALEKREGVVFNWKVNGNSYSGQEKLCIIPEEDCSVELEAVIGTYRVKEVCKITVNDQLRFIGGGDEDGFAESKLGVDMNLRYEPKVCEGDKAEFRLDVSSWGVFTYQWKKEGEDRTLGTEQTYTIESVGQEDKGVYYCICTNTETKKETVSEKVNFEVIRRPEAKIIVPSGSDTILCFGEQMVLRADGIQSGERYSWSGEAITGSTTTQQLRIAPRVTSEYQLFVTRDICWSSDRVTVRVEQDRLRVPQMVYAVKGETVEIEPEGEGVYSWSVDGTHYTEAGVFRYLPTEDVSRVYVKKQTGSCVTEGVIQVFRKDWVNSGVFEDDGYAEHETDFRIIGVNHMPEVCRRAEAAFTVNVEGTSIYHYEWKKEGESSIYSTERTFLIPQTEFIHAGKYYCEVTDPKSGVTKRSETVEMKVLELPQVEVLSPAAGTLVCEGAAVELKVTDNPDWEYLWSGPGIPDACNRSTVTVYPVIASEYYVAVRNGSCVTERTMEVGVKKLHIGLPKVVETAMDYLTEIKAGVPEGATVKWNWEDQTQQGTVLSTYFSRSVCVKATMEYDGCTVTDSLWVYMKDNTMFLGAEEDGYDETEAEFRILGIEGSSTVCENAELALLIRLQGSGLYRYEWMQVDSARIISHTANLNIPKFRLDQSGTTYYCRVTDLFSGDTLVSDPVTVTVRKMPQPVIGMPEHGTWICYGETIRLDARETENGKETPADEYFYVWEGENVTLLDRPYEAEVKPTRSQVYSVGVEFYGCVVYDTITINVLHPKVKVPPVLDVYEGEDICIKAETADVWADAVVNWWNDLRYYPKQDSFELKEVRYSTVVRAEVVSGGCMGKDSTFVYLKMKNYAGGKDDGFMESCEVPVLVENDPRVLGCGGEDSVVLIVRSAGEVTKLTWEKYNEASGKFEVLPEASNLKGWGTDSLTIQPVREEDLGVYQCRVENDCGDVCTETYTITDGTRPQLAITGTKMLEYCEGTRNISFSIPVLNKEGVTYKWYRQHKTTGEVTLFTPEHLYNSEYFNIAQVTGNHDAIYIAEAVNACGSVTDTTVLNVIPALKIVKYIGNVPVCVGGEVSLWVNTTGGKAVTYKLVKYVKEADGSFREEKVCAEGPDNTYTLTAVTLEDAGYYRWTAASDCGDMKQSPMFYVTVENPLVFVAQSQDTTICGGNTLQLSALAESPGCPSSVITYYWEKDGERIGGTSRDLLLNPLQEQHRGSYICYAKNSCPLTASRPVKVELKERLNVTVQPYLDKPSYCEGTEVHLSFQMDFPVLADSVRWFKNSGPGSGRLTDEGSRRSGCASMTLSIDSLLPSDEGIYLAKVYTGCGVVNTYSVALKVDKKARFKRGVSDGELKFVVCEGEQQKLTVEAEGENLQFMWLCNGNKMSEETSNTIEIRFDSTAHYCCHVQNQCGGEYSCADIQVIRADTFRLEGEAAYCQGGEGKPLTLMGSDTNYVYRLYEGERSRTNYLQELSGKDAAYVGGPLEFGLHKKGTYRVIAKHTVNQCEFEMPGVVKITEVALPVKYKLQVADEWCENDTAALLRLGGSEEKGMRYELAVFDTEADAWTTLTHRSGTGDTLLWQVNRVGQYRVEATDTLAGCRSLMEGMPEVKIRPLPLRCQLSALNNDTLYCSGQVSDVTLYVAPGSIEEHVTYTLRKNGLSVNPPLTGPVVEWKKAEEGFYTVKSQNEWGCVTESGGIQVATRPSPVSYRLNGDSYFCAGEAAGDTVIVLEKGENSVRYDLMKSSGEKIATVYGQGTKIEFRVPQEEAEYYVVAADTAAGCSREMENWVKIQASRLTLSSSPVSVEIGNQAQLHVTIRDAIGVPHIHWEPEEHIVTQGVADPFTVPVFDTTQTHYTVTVSDTVCRRSLPVEVIIQGKALSAVIMEADGVIPAPDTLVVCEGTEIEWRSKVEGGIGTYAYSWSKAGVVESEDNIYRGVADSSGYIMLSVVSGRLESRDSVWLEVNALPESKELLKPLTACYGTALKVGVLQAQPGIRYEIYRQTEGGSLELKNKACGRGTDLVIDSMVEVGLYQVKAVDTLTGCGLLLPGSYVVTKLPKVLDLSVQDEEFCAGADNGALLGMKQTESGVWYYLQRFDGSGFADIDTVAPLAGNGESLVFEGLFPAGQYRVRAYSCADVIMNGVANVKEKAYPSQALSLTIAGNACVDSLFEIQVNPTESGTNYMLYFDGVETGQPVLTGDGTVMSWEVTAAEAGKYTVVGEKEGCRMQLNGSVVADSLPVAGLLTGETQLCQNAVTTLCIEGGDSKAGYKLYTYGDKSYVTDGEAENGKICFHEVRMGEYYAVANRGDCRTETDLHRIDPVEEPEVNLAVEVRGQAPFCAGEEYEITVLDARPADWYVLEKDGEPVDTVQGTGTLSFAAVSQAGNYRIRPVAGGICGSEYIDTVIVIHRLPKAVTAENCRYCDDERETAEGCRIELQQVSELTDYMLTQGEICLDTVTGVMGESVGFRPVKAGEYQVVAVDQFTGCRAVAGEVSVMKGLKPQQWEVGVDGDRCGRSIEVKTIGSEGDSVAYYMYRDSIRVAGPLTGNDGGDVSFGLQSEPGVYRIYAVKPSDGCGTFMSDSILIYPELVRDTLTVSGHYCEGGLSALNLHLSNPTPLWSYYLTDGTDYSDTLRESGEALLWNRVGEHELRAGEYILFAVSPCGEETEMDRIELQPDSLPQRFALTEEEVELCPGEKYEIRLQGSKTGTVYTLYRGEVTEAVRTLAGTDTVLNFGEYASAGVYWVSAREEATGCETVMDSVKLKAASLPVNPGIDGEHVCLGETSGSLVIRLLHPQPGVTYYLQKNDSLCVDSLTVSEAAAAAFAAQTAVGKYDVKAVGVCTTRFEGYRIGEKPVVQILENAGADTVCKGESVLLWLENSESGVEYRIYRTEDRPGADTVYTYLKKNGNDGRLNIGTVDKAGIYLIKAYNGCEVFMSGSLELTVESPYEIWLREEGYAICEGDRGVQIEILGITHPDPEVTYDLYLPGDTVAVERINTGIDGASVTSANYYARPGYYVVKENGTRCPEVDSVLVTVRPLPRVWELLNEGTGYLCPQESKEVVLSGSQTGVDYTFYQKAGGQLISKDVKSGTGGRLTFTITDTGTYIVKGKYTGVPPACEQTMSGEVRVDGNRLLKLVRFEGLRTVYCYRVTEDSLKGKVVVRGCEPEVKYQLLKDGVPYGEARQAGSDSAIVWDRLPGGAPKDNRFPDRKYGIDYTLRAESLLTGCTQDISGKVKIVEETEVQYRDDMLKNQMPCVGDAVLLDVQASGGEIIYTWLQKAQGAAGWEEVQRGKNSFYALSSVEESDYGYYKCVVENSCGGDTTVTVEVNPQALIVKEGGMPDKTICSGGGNGQTDLRLTTVIRNATAYTWMKDGEVIPGADKLWLDVRVEDREGTGVYVCKASNRCGELTDTCVVAVDSVPSVSLVHTLRDTLCRGEGILLEVESDFEVKWFKGNEDRGVTGKRYVLDSVSVADEGVYFAVAANGCGEAKVEAGRIWVDDTIRLISVSEDRRLCESTPLNLFVITDQDVTGRVGYRWHDRDGFLLHTGAFYSGIDLTQTAADTLFYRITCSNACSYLYHDIHIRVDRPVDYDRNSPVKELVLCAEQGSDTMLKIIHAENMTVDYQWFFHPVNGTPRILGDNTDSLIIPQRTFSTGAYYCSLTNTCTDSTTRTSWVRIDTVPVIRGHLTDAAVCEGGRFTSSLAFTGGNAACLWMAAYKDGSLDTLQTEVKTEYASESMLVLDPVSLRQDSCRIWAHVMNNCGEARSDTLLLRIRERSHLRIEPDTVVLCEGNTGKVVIELQNGQLPWKYAYTIDEGGEIWSTEKTAFTDTLNVSRGGRYRITRIEGGADGCGLQGETPEFRVEVRTLPLLSFTGGGERCEGDTVSLRLQVEGGIGPWAFRIAKKSGGLATEVMGGEESIVMYRRDTALTFYADESEEYFIYRQVEDRGSGCLGVAPSGSVKVNVHIPAHIEFRTGWPAHIGSCRDVNLRTELQPSVNGVSTAEGSFYVDGVNLNGDQWLKADLLPGCYTVKCMYTDEGGCRVSSDEIRICVDSLPSGAVMSSDFACESVVNYFELELRPAGRIDSVVIRQARYKKWDSIVNPVVKPKYTTIAYPKAQIPSNGLVQIPLNWDEVGGIDSCMTFEVLDIFDIHGCRMNHGISVQEYDFLYRDTVWRHWDPVVDVQIRLAEDKLWEKGIHEVNLAADDSVQVKVSLIKGMPLWALPGLGIEAVTGTDTVFWLKREGTYYFQPKDLACGRQSTAPPYDLTITHLDTGYFRGRLLLEGPYDEENGMMSHGNCHTENLRASLNLPEVLPLLPAGLEVIDRVEVELRISNGFPVDSVALMTRPDFLLTRDTCLLLSDGHLADRWTGDTVVGIRNAYGSGSNRRYIAVRHRNHLGIMTARLYAFVGSGSKQEAVWVDFTDIRNVYHRSNAEQMSRHMSSKSRKGKMWWMLSAGELNENSLVTLQDPNRVVREDIDPAAKIRAIETGRYDLLHDINLDGCVDWPGWNGKTLTDWLFVQRNRQKYTEIRWK